MNAKWMPAMGAAAVWTAMCLVSTADAVPAGDAQGSAASVRPSAAAPLTRAEVDKLLSLARAAIENGNLDQAEAFVSRAESAQIRYQLFHVGPTPQSVRRELMHAQRASGRRGDSLQQSDDSRYGVENQPSTDDRYSAAPADPFAERSIALPAGIGSQPVPPGGEGRMTPPVVPALHSQPVGVPDRSVRRAMALNSNQDEPWAQYDAPLPPSLRAAGDSSSPYPRLASPGDPAVDPVEVPIAIDRGEPVANTPKERAMDLLRHGRQALVAGDFEGAEEAARRATLLGVPESAFLPHEDRPSLLAWDVRRARDSQSEAVEAIDRQDASGDRYAQQARLTPEQDAAVGLRMLTPAVESVEPRLAQLPEPLELPPEGTEISDEPLPPPSQHHAPVPPAEPMPRPMANSSLPSTDGDESTLPSSRSKDATSDAAELLKSGEFALKQKDRQTAATLLGQAYVLRDELSQQDQDRLRKYLSDLAASAPAPSNRFGTNSTGKSNLIDAAADSEQALARQLSAEVGKKQSEARRLRDKEPQQALEMLKETREQIVESQLSEEFRTQLLRRIDITLEETEKYFRDHRAEIEIDQKNQAVLDEVNRNREVKVKVQQKVAELVEEFNRLRDEQRYAEMEIVARRLIELAPEELVAQQLWQQSKFIRRTIMNQQLADRREDGYWGSLYDVESSSVPNVGDGRELVYDQKYWDGLVKNRKPGAGENRRTERELEIERRLKTPVLLRYEDMPLSEVVRGLSELASVNIHLDPQGLSQEGINSDTPVTINLSKEISLKSALNLVLGPLHLTYIINDEVLKITSEQLRDGNIEPRVYNVADLVIPIPNFVPNNNIGLQGLINDAHATMGYGQQGLGMPGPTVLVNDRSPHGQAAPGDGNVLAQQFGGAGGGTSSVPIGSGPGGMGGGANADFDSLIDLIVSTVATDTWAENGGGEAEIRPFPTNLSLVISQTQAVHEEIADLLQQLRRLQDLQVTIEVRFIRLNDSFFERIGVDFDMNIEDRTIGTADLTPGAVYEPQRQSAIVGLQFPVPPTNPFPNFTSDLDIPFRQQSFDLTTPTFGGPQQVANFGFAILSDIEAYFLIEAAQGDRRTNVLNAPKVTLFNGQQAFVADAVSRPFVLGVIPVVGEFVAAQQPVIVVLNEGTMMSIQAVVSNDRRYVRLTVVPFFTEVGDVQEFTFEGSSSSSNSSSTTDDDEDGNEEMSDNQQANARSGVTVQLPAFQFVAVVTTVSVPDGGTVLLGGIKRLSEGRNEVGVPLLSKIPYINRLFRNVGIGRETDSLMMMVTPRIIIQEEEEERLGITAGP